MTDVLLRLIYFYQLTSQPYESAVLGEYVAHTIKSTGGKAALAGLFGINGYVIASMRAKAAADRTVDRQHAASLARYLDQNYPNDNSTDAARHRLASLLIEDKKQLEAFQILLKIRPAYGEITSVRLLEGYLASALVAPKNSELFRREEAGDLPAGLGGSREDRQARFRRRWRTMFATISPRLRLGTLLLAQKRVDQEAEKARPGYNQALGIAQDVMRIIPSFNSMTSGGAKSLTLDGQEMMLLARDVQARAIYLRAAP